MMRFFLLAMFALAQGGIAAAQSPPQLLGKAVVFNFPLTDPYDLHNLYGFNHAPSVKRLPDGRLLAAWFSGPYEGSVHQVILSAASEDGGETWSRARVLHDTPQRSDFDANLIVDGDRTFMFFTVGRWNRYPFVGLRAVEQEEVGVDSYHIYMKHSDDSGRTWSEPVRIFEGEGWGCRSNGIRLSSGELILPLHHFKTHVASALRSNDGGATWRKMGEVSPEVSRGAAEPSIAETGPGQLRMVVRSRDGNLWTTTSDDRGETWAELSKTGLEAAASSHSLFRMDDGRLVLTHNPSPPPKRTPLTMRVSNDGGQTWGEPLVIASVEHPTEDEPVWSRQVSYPSVTQLDDQTLLAVWTQIEMSADDQSGTIYSARVRID